MAALELRTEVEMRRGGIVMQGRIHPRLVSGHGGDEAVVGDGDTDWGGRGRRRRPRSLQ